MEKKTTADNKLAVMAISMNFVLLVVMAFVFNSLWTLEKKVDSLSKNQPAVSVQKDTDAAGVPGVIQIQTKSKDIELTVSDEGFLPSGFQIGKKEKMVVTITNEGKTAHSFVINELGIDSGPIDPGQKVSVSIDKEFTEAKVMEFVSGMENDDKEIFKGTVMVF